MRGEPLCVKKFEKKGSEKSRQSLLDKNMELGLKNLAENEAREKMFYSSFNCFYSALGSYLCKHNVSRENVRLSMDLQWQFFYHDVFNYNSENRIIGEFPYIYEKNLNERIRLLTGYQFRRYKNGNFDLSDVDADIRKNGQAILFVNKQVVGEILNQSERDSSVTTILVESSSEKGSYHVHKPNFYGDTKHDVLGKMTKDELREARFKSVDGYELCGERIVCEKIRNAQSVDKKQVVTMLLLRTIEDYIMSHHKQLENITDCWYGKLGMEKFSEQVVDWSQKYDYETLFKRIDFSAMGLIFVKRQRLIFFEALNELLKGTYVLEEFFSPEEDKRRHEILDQWGDVRIYMRLLSYKKSVGGIRRVSQYIQYIKKLEYEYLEELRKHLVY